LPRVEALTALAPHLPADLMPRALDAAAALNENDFFSSSPRAKALAGLAPHLPADLMARALDAALTIRDHYSRVEALTALAPHLPASQLARALDAAAGNLEITTALLRRSESTVTVIENDIFLDLLRSSLNGGDRAFCLSIVARMASSIVKWGGSGVAQECVGAITDTALWWQ
jgi:hypothetical protein